MKKYSFGVSVRITNEWTDLFNSKGFDFIIGQGYWFCSGSEWEEALKLVKGINGGKI